MEVTVTVVMHTTFVGVPVIVTGVEAFDVVMDCVKKGAEPDPSSFFAETSIVTPCDGIVDVIVTVSGKSACGAAGWFDPTGGFNVTARFASPDPPPPLSEQL